MFNIDEFDVSSLQPKELIALAKGIKDARKKGDIGVEFINGRIYVSRECFEKILAKIQSKPIKPGLPEVKPVSPNEVNAALYNVLIPDYNRPIEIEKAFTSLVNENPENEQQPTSTINNADI